MHKFFKNVRCLKCICFLLVCFFVINVTAGCAQDNGVPEGLENAGYVNKAVGTGNNIQGYTIYGESTFDPMTQELFYGYLLSGRHFTLLVVPGKSVDDGYAPIDDTNVLFASAQAGVYQFDPSTATFKDSKNKALIYYATDLELKEWFKNAEASDNIFNAAAQFFNSSTDLESPSRYACKDLVNMGGGLNAEDFCGFIVDGKVDNPNQTKVSNIFKNSHTGGMVLLFGEGSIEGYFTYDDIKNNKGSEVANALELCEYKYVNKGYDFANLLASDETRARVLSVLFAEYDVVNDLEKQKDISNKLNSLIQGQTTDQEFKKSVASAYAEIYLLNARGCERLRRTYELMERSLIEDAVDSSLISRPSSSASGVISTLRTVFNNKYSNETDEGRKEEYLVLRDLCDMFSEFGDSAKDEAFNIKFSISLWSRFNSIKNVSKVDADILTGITYEEINVPTTENAYKLRSGDYNDSGNNNGNYLLLITADGYVIDRGTPQEQVEIGMMDDVFGTAFLAEMIKMDACANTTLALEAYNLLANLKMVAGFAMAYSGAALAISVTVAAVLLKISAVSAATPVPGGRIVALALLAVAGLIALGVGIYTMYSAYEDKKRIENLGGSKENYCETYTATLKLVLEELSLSVPIYHYNIREEDDIDENDELSLMYCNKGTYDYDVDKCLNDKKEDTGSKPFPVTLAYYAEKDIVQKLQVEGAPMLIYYRNNEIVDYVYGAATPSFVVEMLRLWGLLAMREIVYTIKSDGDNLGIHHTNNVNTNTLNITEASYCIGDEYKKNPYEVGSGDFCHNKATININKTWSGDSSKAIFNLQLSQITAELEETVKSKYSGLYSESKAYKANQLKNKYINVPTEIEYYEESVTIMIPVIQNKYYLHGSSLYYKEFVDGVEKYRKIGSVKVEMSKEEIENLFAGEVISGYNITSEEFLDYLSGVTTFDEESITYSLYLNVAVKEDQHAMSSDGKYLYYQTGTLFGWFNGYVWKKAEDVKGNSNYRAVSVSEALRNGKNPVNTDTVYVTGKEIAQVVVTLDSQGNETVNLRIN